MEEDWLDALNEDLKGISELKIEEDTRAREKVMHAMAEAFLKIWMRFAIDLGKKMNMIPSDVELGLYKGGNNWQLNESFNFAALSEISIANREDKHHALILEGYTSQGREHLRIIFSLEEERILEKIVMVNYLVYDSLAKDFKVSEAIEKLKPGLSKWYLALAENELSILWNFCIDNYELIGV